MFRGATKVLITNSGAMSVYLRVAISGSGHLVEVAKRVDRTVF